jgi:hypothetical protein
LTSPLRNRPEYTVTKVTTGNRPNEPNFGTVDEKWTTELEREKSIVAARSKPSH